MQKDFKFNIFLFLVTGALTIWANNRIAIILFILVQIGGWLLYYLKQDEEMSSIVKNVELEADAANVRADDALDKLKALINAIPSPLVYINQRGDFEVSNQYFDRLIGEEAIDVYDSVIDFHIRQILLDAFLNEKQFIKQLNHDDVDYQVLSIPLVSDDNRYNGCMLIFQDVTRVVDGEKMQKRFIADASHELRTPITSIKGMIEILNREDFNDPEAAKEFHEQIEKENNRLQKIVDDLLLQSRLRSNQVYLEKTRFNLKLFFDGLIYERRQELHQANINVVLNCPSNLELDADQFRLSQVFLNLFNNAINYAKDGEIRINCSEKNKRIKIEFKDNGEGINPDILPHIFERFFRGNPARGRTNGSSGLGLAISKSIIESHGGEISVSSEAGKGTCFTIII